MKAEIANAAGGPRSVKQERFKNHYLNCTQMNRKILKKIQAEHESPFLSSLAGRIASRLEGRAE
jgi:hypothetical protein